MRPYSDLRRQLAVAFALVLAATGCSASDDDVSSSSDGGTSGNDARSYDGGRVDAGSDGGVADGGKDAADDSGAGAPSAADLLAKVASCNGEAIKGGFGLDGPGSISIYSCGSAVYWKADLDIDCDGIQTPPCDTDKTGQPQTSIAWLAPDGDVDPTKLPFIVIPLGDPKSEWYEEHGIDLGQVGAVIYKGQVEYGIFADQAGGAFIGEASYAMCQLFLGKPSGGNDPCDPNMGGIDPADVTYVMFTGNASRAKGKDIYDHAKHEAMGIAAAKAWLAAP